MDDSITPVLSGTGGPAVVAANWYRFEANERIRHPEVASVSFVWSLEGSGLIRCGHDTFRLDRTVVLALPWRHDVEYQADSRSPFHIGTVHLVPWNDFAVPVEPRVGHRADDPLRTAPWRTGGGGPNRPRTFGSFSTEARRLISLASFSVETFVGRSATEESMRALGVLVAAASRACDEAAVGENPRPVTLDLMIDYALKRLDTSLSVSAIALAGGVSTSTASRLFVKYTGQSVLAWVRRRQMEEAALLLRTTGLRVGEVARRVGFTDPLYFSRVFRATFSVPPSRYGAGQIRP